MPPMRLPVTHQQTAASAVRTTASRICSRSTRRNGPAGTADAVISTSPAEVRRESGVTLVLDTEAVHLGVLCVRDRQCGARGMEDAHELRRLAGLDAEGDHVLDLYVNRFADLDRVRQAVFVELDRRPLDPPELAQQRAKRSTRPTERPAEDHAAPVRPTA